MATTVEWIQQAEKLTDRELEDHIQAMDQMSRWTFFEAEYAWTGLETVRCILRRVQADRVTKLSRKIYEDTQRLNQLKRDIG